MKKITLQGEVIKRFMSDLEFATFQQTYREHLYKQKSVREPNEKDLRIASHFQKSQSYKTTAKELGVSTFYVMSAVGRAYAFKR